MTAKQGKSPAIATESIILPVQSRQDRRKQLKAVVENNQDNDRTTTIQVTDVRPGRPTVGGDTLALTNNINIMVFKQVMSALQPLLPAATPADHDAPDEFIISVTDCDQKLS